MNPYQVLGLHGDATEIHIKRAYARVLKQHRPDSDPAGFQRVHEAYTHCLAHARYRAEYGADQDADDEIEEQAFETATADAVDGEAAAGRALLHADVVDVRRTQELSSNRALSPLAQEDAPQEGERNEVSFNVDAFVDQLLRQALEDRPSELKQWLHGHEDLYSLQLTQLLTGPVANGLAQSEHLPRDENVGIVLAFFGLDGVGQHHSWLAHPLQVLWERQEDRRGFESLRSHYASRHTKAVDRMLLRELLSPRHWLRFLVIVLCPTLPSRTRHLLLRLEQLAPREAAARIAPGTARFWRLAADRDRLDRRRWLVVLMRLPWMLPVAAYVALISQTRMSAQGFAVAGISVLAIWFVWALVVVGWRRLVRFNQEKLHWDLPLAGVCFMFVLTLLASLVLPGLVGPLCSLTLFFWLVQRNGLSYFAGLFAAITGGALVLSLGLLLPPSGTSLGSGWWVSAAVYSVGSVIVHDALYARVHRQSLIWARGQSGWLGWLLAGHSALVIIILVVGLPLAGP